MSLRAKFLVLFAVFAVVPLVAIGIFDYVYSMRALETLIATQVEEIATRSAEQIDQNFALRESELLLLSENAETQRLYQALANDDPRAWELALGSADAYLRQAWDVLSPFYSWIEFRDVHGATVYRLPPEADPGSADLRGGASFRTNVMAVVRPIHNETHGGEVGSLSAAIDLEELVPYEELAARFGETGYSTVVDRSRNMVVYHPSHAYRDQNVGALLGPDGWDIDYQVLEEERGTLVYRESDTTRVAAFVSLAEPPWTIFAAGS
ncbi:MAG: hypothetical protein AMS21_09015, partial [Gemmatimonas sp. SG8_38_2]